MLTQLQFQMYLRGWNGTSGIYHSQDQKSQESWNNRHTGILVFNIFSNVKVGYINILNTKLMLYNAVLKIFLTV